MPKYFQCPNWVKSIADDLALKVWHCICLIYWIAYSFNIYSSMRICHFQLLNISKMLAFLHFKIFLKNSYSCMEFSILQKLRGLSLMILSSEVKCFKICSTNFWNRKKNLLVHLLQIQSFSKWINPFWFFLFQKACGRVFQNFCRTQFY